MGENCFSPVSAFSPVRGKKTHRPVCPAVATGPMCFLYCWRSCEPGAQTMPHRNGVNIFSGLSSSADAAKQRRNPLAYKSMHCPGSGCITRIFGCRSAICSANQARAAASPCPRTTVRGCTSRTKSRSCSRFACAERSKSCSSHWRVTSPASGLKKNCSPSALAFRRPPGASGSA